MTSCNRKFSLKKLGIGTASKHLYRKLSAPGLFIRIMFHTWLSSLVPEARASSTLTLDWYFSSRALKRLFCWINKTIKKLTQHFLMRSQVKNVHKNILQFLNALLELIYAAQSPGQLFSEDKPHAVQQMQCQTRFFKLCIS